VCLPGCTQALKGPPAWRERAHCGGGDGGGQLIGYPKGSAPLLEHFGGLMKRRRERDLLTYAMPPLGECMPQPAMTARTRCVQCTPKASSVPTKLLQPLQCRIDLHALPPRQERSCRRLGHRCHRAPAAHC
jgi:hypothetical protein